MQFWWMEMDAKTLFALGGYMLCSASMLVANKAAVHFVPAPSFLLLLQMLGTVLMVKGGHAMGLLESCDQLAWSKVKAFTPVALIFTATIYTNMASLQYANVETFMVFRFSTPLTMCVADYLFLGRQLPPLRSWVALFMLLAGSIGYTVTDAAFHVKGYFFCGLWYFIFCLDQVYLKHIVDTVKMESTWGRVYYSNLLPCVPLVLTGVVGSEYAIVMRSLSLAGAVTVAITVVMGAALSYFAWKARALVAATTFTVVGNVCKILTMMLNFMLWDFHAGPVGLSFLAFSFAGAYLYRQAPLRDEALPKAKAAADSSRAPQTDVEMLSEAVAEAGCPAGRLRAQ